MGISRRQERAAKLYARQRPGRLAVSGDVRNSIPNADAASPPPRGPPPLYLPPQTVAGFLFSAAGAYQMAVWAQGKHRRLQKLFDGKDGRPKYPKRWIMLPPFF